MLLVAGDTTARRCRKMETTFCGDLILNLGMAGQALRTANLAAAFMALRAVGHSLEPLMRLAELSRRDLGSACLNA